MTQHKIGVLILRLAMAGVYLYFGLSQILDSAKWATAVPEWAANLSHMSPAAIAFGNGVFEVVLAALLAIGLWVGPVAILLAIHLFVIAVSLGWNPVGIRDFGLAFATLSIFFLSKKQTLRV